MKLAALWITKNEVENLGRSIKSLGGMADELVVVDTGSTDDTVALAESLGARVAHFEWADDFAAARNFALRQTDADAVLFLDADEWFAPALDKAGRAALEGLFADGKNLVGTIRLSDVEQESGVVFNEANSVRALRGKGAVAFHGRIHEHVLPCAGGKLTGAPVPGLRLMHDGYSRARQPEKLRRNYNILKEAAPLGPDDVRKALYHFYLMREANRLGEAGAAYEGLAWLLRHPVLLRQFLRDYPESGVTFMFEAIRVAARFRAKVSRRQVWQATVENAQKLCAGHPLHHTIGLYYELYFGGRDGVLLAEIDSAMEKGERQRGDTLADMDDYLLANGELFTAAGQAAWRRGNRELAFDYASRALRLSKTVVRPETMALLLNCVRGLPGGDIAAFLGSMVDVGQHSILESLLPCLRYEGMREVHTYFIKKMLDAGWAKKSDFWYLMITLGKVEEAAAAALEAAENTEGEVVRRTLFLAVACAGQKAPDLLERCRAGLGRYEPLAAYLAGGAPPKDPPFDIAGENYGLIAFAAGRQAANRMLAPYAGKGRECWLLQAEYYMNSGLYRELLLEGRFMPKPDDAGARLLRGERDVLAKDHERALAEIKVLLANSEPNAGIFNLCAVVAENADSTEARREAGLLLEQVQPLYEEMVDWQDIANTDWLPEADTKKQRRTLAQLTVGQFDRSVVRRGFQPLVGQLEAADAAARRLVAQARYDAALPPLRRRLEFCAATDETWKLLAALFDGAGNPALAEAMRGRVPG